MDGHFTSVFLPSSAPNRACQFAGTRLSTFRFHSYELSSLVFGLFQSHLLTSLLPAELTDGCSPSPCDMLSIPQTTTTTPPSMSHINRSQSSLTTGT